MLVYLSQKKGNVISSVEIADAMRIPQKYLIRIARKLRDAQILETNVGSGGGYTLKRDPEDISMYEVIKLMEGTIKINKCLEEGNPDDGKNCTEEHRRNCHVHACYEVLQDGIEGYLHKIRIGDMIKEAEIRKAKENFKKAF